MLGHPSRASNHSLVTIDNSIVNFLITPFLGSASTAQPQTCHKPQHAKEGIFISSLTSHTFILQQQVFQSIFTLVLQRNIKLNDTTQVCCMIDALGTLKKET